jgi:SAM-dependent methyltransferase
MALKDLEKWNQKYGASDCLAGRDPCEWLASNANLLGTAGRALDLAMGEGRNAIYAASLGYDVLGVDISDIGVRRANDLAHQRGLTIQTEVTDLDHYTLPENAFDLILCFYFLDRRLYPQIRRGLKPGGLVLFETFSVGHLQYSSFKKEWVLEPNELVREFMDLHILRYREVDDPKEQKAFASIAARQWNS